MLQKFFTDNAERISGMTKLFPPAGWAAEGLLGDWGQLALFATVSIAAAVLLVWGLGFFYRKLALLQSETPHAKRLWQPAKKAFRRVLSVKETPLRRT